MTQEQSWYSARILMEAVHPDEPPGSALFEDKVILVKAGSERQVKAKAGKLGKKDEHEYLNVEGNRVSWVFREVLDVVALFDEALTEGTEVYYKFLSEEDLQAVRRSLQPGSLG